MRYFQVKGHFWEKSTKWPQNDFGMFNIKSPHIYSAYTYGTQIVHPCLNMLAELSYPAMTQLHLHIMRGFFFQILFLLPLDHMRKNVLKIWKTNSNVFFYFIFVNMWAYRSKNIKRYSYQQNVFKLLLNFWKFKILTIYFPFRKHRIQRM